MKVRRMNGKKWLSYGILCILVPVIVLGGAVLFADRQYAWVAFCVAVLACAALLLSFEGGRPDVKKLLLLAVMTALSVAGRLLFAPIPGFKPVTAIVVITAMYFGGEAGFVTGALSALISNFYFSQGPWTPFQMLVWGMIGLVAGVMGKAFRTHRALLLLYGAVSGVVFSLLMDVWTVLWAEGTLNASRYIAVITASAPYTLEYAVSNVVFLLVLAGPLGRILGRIKTKYGL